MDSVPVGTVLRVEVTPDEAAAIRERATYAGALMRYHAFVSDTDAVQFWHDGKLLATINDQGVVTYSPLILILDSGPNQLQRALSGTAKSPFPNAVV